MTIPAHDTIREMRCIFRLNQDSYHDAGESRNSTSCSRSVQAWSPKVDAKAVRQLCKGDAARAIPFYKRQSRTLPLEKEKVGEGRGFNSPHIADRKERWSTRQAPTETFIVLAEGACHCGPAVCVRKHWMLAWVEVNRKKRETSLLFYSLSLFLSTPAA